jgi:hypothetical protein
MLKARGQAERYVRALPASDPNPPFLLVVDVGNSIEVFADFTQAGRNYLHFPHPQAFRIRLDDLRLPEIRERLRLVWTDPHALDPARHSAVVTCEISDLLAKLAKSLEQAGHTPRQVADFLCRCLFCMFAEDAGLLPAESFTRLLDSVRPDPAQFQPLTAQLFREMNTGPPDASRSSCAMPSSASTAASSPTPPRWTWMPTRSRPEFVLDFIH